MENRIKAEDEVKNRGGFRDESSHLYVVIDGSYIFLFPEEKFDELSTIDRKIIWDTVDFVLQNALTNEEGDTEYTFDMFDLMTISHTIVLPPINLKVDIGSDDNITSEEFDTLYNDIAYHVHSNVMKKAGGYMVYVNRAVYDSLSEVDKDIIIDNASSIAWSGCDKHIWFIESHTDFMNLSNIIFIDIKPICTREFVLDEIKEYGGFRDTQTGEYVLYQYPCTFVLPEWFENVDKTCRDNIYYACYKISQDSNRPSSSSTNSYTYKWDDIMSCMGKYSFDQRKQYDGPGAMEQLMERQIKDQLSSFDTDIMGNRIVFGTHHSPLKGEISVSIKRCIWDTLSPSVQSELTAALQSIIKAHSNDKYPFMGWDLTTLESVYYFIEAAKRDPASLSQRTFIDTYTHTDALLKKVYCVKVFDFMIGHVESFEFIIGKGNFFDKPLDNEESIEKEAMRIALLHSEERKVSFKLSTDCYVWKLEGDHFVPYYPEPTPIIPDPEIPEFKLVGSMTMIGGFDGTTFYVTDNDEIVKENIYEDEVRGERCKILKFTAERNGIYFFSIEMAAWNSLDAVTEDMLVTKARIVSKIGCGSHIWHFNSVGAVDEFLNIPVKDEKNLLGLNNTNPNLITTKEENTMFNKFPFKKKNNDNLPKKKETNNPTIPTSEQAKVIMDAMYACQADISQYTEEMRRNRARANATMARAVLTHGILTDSTMVQRNFLLPKDVNYQYAARLDGELVAITNGKSPTEQVLDTFNSVPVTNLQDYANILGTLSLAKEQSENGELTTEEEASIITNYIGCRDQALLNMLQDTNSLKSVIGENTVKEIENTEFKDPMITTSPTVMKYITIVDKEKK